MGQRQLAVSKLLTREDESVTRHVDMQLAVYLGNTPTLRRGQEPLLRVGGRWDRQDELYTGDARNEVRVWFHEGQRAAAECLAEWFAKHAEVRAMRRGGVRISDAVLRVWDERLPMYNLLLYGGRRGGKSDIAVAGGCIMGVMVPGSRVVMVSPTQKDTDELKIAIEERFLPPEWRRWAEGDNTFLLANGSRIELMTGKKGSLKIGRTDYVLYNEGQEMPERGWTQLQGGTADVAGLSVCTCNPPSRKLGQWVQDWYYEFTEGLRPNDRAFFINPEENPFIDYGRLLAMRASLSETEYRREVLGDMSTPVGLIVYSAWSDACILQYIPSGWRDVTNEVARRWYGGDAEVLAGNDFDALSGCSWTAQRFYLPSTSRDIVDAEMVVLDARDGLEGREPEQVRSMLEARDRYGYKLLDPKLTRIVGDASGAYQDAQHKHDEPPSWAHLRAAGYTVVYPDEQERRNPDVVARFAKANHLLRHMPDQNVHRRVHFLPEAARAIDAARHLPTQSDGTPKRRDKNAHVSDCWGYVAWRRWGRDDALTREINATFQTIALPDRGRQFGARW